MVFTITINDSGTKWVHIDVGHIFGGTIDCLNYLCSTASYTDYGGLGISRITLDTSTGDYVYDILADDTTTGLPLGDVLTFTLCPVLPGSSAYCYTLWDHLTWASYSSDYPDSSTVNDMGGQELSWCDEPWGGCSSGCDQITHYNQGDYSVFCVTRNGGLSPGSQIVISFTPPLRECAPITWDGYIDSVTVNNRDTLPNGTPYAPDSVFFDGKEVYFWGKDTTFYGFNTWYKSGSGISGDTETDTLSADVGHDLGPCGTFCFYIKHCKFLGPENHTVTIYTLPGDTTGCPSLSDSGSFKRSPTQRRQFTIENSLPNFPNPFGISSGFKTSIPYATPTTGTASISIFNEAGELVTTETMEATYAGEHYFYYTGDRLPAGRYFYNIEFPQGTIISEHSMLLVK